MSAKDTGLVIGGEPRIDFLPPEVKAGKQARRTRRSLMALVLLVVAACVAGYVFATSLAVQSQGELADAQDRTRALVQEQGEYQSVRTVTAELAATTNARLVGSATEVLWKDYLAQLVTALPSETTVDTYTVESQTAMEGSPVTTIPLQNQRMATVNFVAEFPTLAKAKAVLESLATLPGYADAWATPIELTDEGAYTATFTLNVNAEIAERRFFEAEEPVADGAEETSAEGEE